MGEDYDVPEYDWQSLKEIQKLVKGNKYNDISQVKEHLEFLEDAANKINSILSSEQARGIVDLDTSKFSVQVRKTYDDLFEIYDKMIDKLPSQHIDAKKKKIKKAQLIGISSREFERFDDKR